MGVRMYRDVKKKLLSVALCICMIIGLVQVVPRAKAAAKEPDEQGYYHITVPFKTGGSNTVRVKISGMTSLTYKGGAYNPTISEV